MKSVINIEGKAGVSSKALTADAVVTLTRASGAIGALITVETNSIRFAFGQNPTQAGVGHVLVAGGGVHIRSGANVANFRYINKTNGSQATVTVTQFTEN